MRNLRFIALLVSVLLMACTNDNDKQINETEAEPLSPELQMQERLAYLEGKMFSDEADITVKNKTVFAKEAFRLYTEYAKMFPEDSLNESFLYKASDLAMNLKMYDDAMICFNNLQQHYPNFEHMDVVYLMKGELFGDQYKQKDSAQFYFEKLINEFPTSAYKQSAQDRLNNMDMMGMSEAELIEFLEKKNQ